MSQKEYIQQLEHDIDIKLSAILEYEEEIRRIRAERDKALSDIKQFQIPMLMIQENWEPSKCPRCKHDFHEYEDCDDGYYGRAYSLERCPYYGQKIKWSCSISD